MACIGFKDKLDEYIDGLLGEDEQAALDRHLADCGACRQLLEREHELLRLLRNYGETAVAVPDEAWFDSRLATAAASGRRESRVRWLAIAIAVAVVATIAALLIGGGRAAATQTPVASVVTALETPDQARHYRIKTASLPEEPPMPAAAQYTAPPNSAAPFTTSRATPSPRKSPSSSPTSPPPPTSS